MTPVLVCWDCGAANHRDDRKCWLCGRPDWKPDAVSPTAATVAETTDCARLKSSVSTNRKGRSLLWSGLLLLSFPISILLAIAIGVVWASFVDKPGIRPDQSMVAVIPWIVPPIGGLYLVTLAAFFVYRVFRHKQ